MIERCGLAGWLFAALLVLAHPVQALAHASLLSSDPASEAVLVRSPASYTLTFNEPVEPLLMRIIDGRGVTSMASQIERRGNSLIVMQAASLAAGVYVLSWRVTSADGHPVGGALPFWVGARDAAAPQVTNGGDDNLHAAIWATRLLLYVGLFVGVGGAFFIAWMTMPLHLLGPGRISMSACIAGLVATVMSIGLQGLDALAAPFSALTLPGVWTIGTQGSFGRSIAFAALALITGLLSLRYRNGIARTFTTLALLGVGAALAASGHAATADARLVAVASVALHGMSLAFWIGALAPLACVMRSGASALVPLMQFSRAIPYAVAVLLLSGVFLAVVQVQHVEALWSTDYGRILAIKLGLVLVLFAIALWNRLRLTPRIARESQSSFRQMRMSILSELALVALILGTVGLWRFAPPPRLLAVTVDDFFVHIHSEKAMANATITPGSAGPVEIIVQLETPDERPLTALGLSVSLANPDIGIEPVIAQAQRMDDGRWRVHLTPTVPGRWMLGLGILISDFDKVDIEAPVLIK